MMEKIDLASTEEQGVEDIPYNLPNKQNICMMTQKLLKMFLVLPKPNVFSLSKASTDHACDWADSQYEEGVLVEVVGHKQYHAEAEPSPQREGYGGDGQGYLCHPVCGAGGGIGHSGGDGRGWEVVGGLGEWGEFGQIRHGQYRGMDFCCFWCSKRLLNPIKLLF